MIHRKKFRDSDLSEIFSNRTLGRINCLRISSAETLIEPTDQKERQHRFAQYLNHEAKRCAPIGLGELIASLGFQPRLRVGFAEATERFREVKHYTS